MLIRKNNFIKKKNEDENKELRKMSREQLLTLLLSVSRENEKLREELEEKEKELENRKIIMENVGSIADAAAEINRIFQVAQQTADDYLEGVKASNKPQEPPEPKNENETAAEKKEACSEDPAESTQIEAEAKKKKSDKKKKK